MKKLILVTGNKHKYEEIKDILGKPIKLTQKNLAIEEPDLNTIEDIARYKAKQAFSKLKKPIIVEDTGVYFSDYKNFPGHLAKRVFEGIGFNGLLALVKAGKKKQGYFKTIICYKDKKQEKLFSGIMQGKLLTKLRKEHADRLPYEKLFVPKGKNKAISEMSKAEKNKISHRAKATVKLKKFLGGKR